MLTAALYGIQPLALLIVAAVVVTFGVVVLANRIVIIRLKSKKRQTEAMKRMLHQAVDVNDYHVMCLDLRRDILCDLEGNPVLSGDFTLQRCINNIHPDDRHLYIDAIERLRSGAAKSVDVSYRWNFTPQEDEPEWHNIKAQAVAEYTDNGGHITSIIATMHDVTSEVRQEEEINDLMHRYRNIFDHSIIGLSFYSPDGRLMDCNQMMRKMCHFDTEEGDAFFSNTNLFDVPPFRDNVDRNNVQDFWVCSQSQIVEKGMNEYLEIRLHPIRDEQGQLVFLSIAAREVTEERRMYLEAKRNELDLQEVNKKISQYEAELRYMMEACDMRAWRSSFADRTIEFYKGRSGAERRMTFEEFQSYFIDETGEVAKDFDTPDDRYNDAVSVLRLMKPLFHDTDKPQWNQINSIPIHDKDGRYVGSFGLIRNMSRYVEAQEQLKQETQRANESGRLKSVFLANMTHEIRTPLNAIVGFSDLLQAIEAPEDKREMIRIIHNNCDMLLRLINDILAISQMDSNGLIISPSRIDFAQAFDDICQSLSGRVTEPAVQFIKENPYRRLVTSIDRGRIEQVITNFVTNAVKYTHEGHIRVGYRRQEDGLCIYCEDTGTGIPKEQCSKVFERFVKLNDFIQGTGLGLSICKAIAERCGGRIGVDSELGQGSTFWIWIPCEIEDAEE